MYVLSLLQTLLLLVSPVLSSDEAGGYDREFYDSCAKGDIEKVKQFVDDDLST